MGAESFQKNMEKGLIEVAPLAYMRGRTLDNAFIILDEAQNTTPAQMKMFLTRIGFGSKAVITGDATQKRSGAGCRIGLGHCAESAAQCGGDRYLRTDKPGCRRHPVVQKIVKAYEDYEKRAGKTSGTRKNTSRTGAGRTGARSRRENTNGRSLCGKESNISVGMFAATILFTTAAAFIRGQYLDEWIVLVIINLVFLALWFFYWSTAG